jgi:hypothetical protein
MFEGASGTQIDIGFFWCEYFYMRSDGAVLMM